jgi:hypothetical protein
MKRILAASLAVVTALVLRGPNTTGQEATAETAPFSWKTSGTTLADFKIELTPAKPLDQSSAEACVRSYLSLADGRESALATLEGLQQDIEGVIANELNTGMARLLSEDLVKQPPAQPTPKSRTGDFGDGWTLGESEKLLPTFGKGTRTWSYVEKRVVTRVVPIETGDVCIGVSKLREEGDARPYWTDHFAFLCRKGPAETWMIVAVQSRMYRDAFSDLRSDPDMPEMPPYEPVDERWGFVDLPFAALQRWGRDDPAPASDGSSGTKEELIAALFKDVFQRRLRLHEQLHGRALAAWLSAVTPLFLPESVAKMKEEADHIEFAKAAELGYEILEHRTDPISVLVRKEDQFKTQWLFEVKEADGKWRITGAKRRFTATRVRDGVEVENLRDATSIWEGATEWLPSANDLSVFLR